MKSRSTARSKLATALIATLLAAGCFSAAEAAQPSQKELLAACRAKYGKGITGAVVKKNGQIVCQEGPGRQATRKEVFEYCRKKYSATTLIVTKKGNGWQCRYYGRY
jgi:hypothetical protein